MVNRTTNEYGPDYAVAPGETLLETLEELGLTQAELASRTGLSRKHVNQIVQGNAALTPSVADKLEMATGVPARLWTNLEANFRADLERLKALETLRGEVGWLSKVPHREMARRGWIPDRDGRVEQLREVLRFFGTATPQVLENQLVASGAAFRNSAIYASDPGSVSAWLRAGDLMARKVACQPYQSARFRSALKQIRGLTTSEGSVFQPRMVALCAAAGVAVVCVPQLPGTSASGAARWLTPDKALIQLSLRYKKDDHFWFSFFHEAGHILLHGKSGAYIHNDPDTEQSPDEIEANEFAANFLIPSDDYRRLIGVGVFPKVTVLRFAMEMGIAPGIVVGRLQHDEHVPWQSALNSLKRTYEWAREE